MSAFIVSDETMHRVVNAIVANNMYFGETPTRSNGAETSIGKLLYKLNALAVNSRYNEGEEAPDYRYKPIIRGDLVATYKSLQCLMYQCSEGDVPEMELFKELEDLSHRLAHRIVSDLPAYAAANWD